MQAEIIKNLIFLQILVYQQRNPEVGLQRMNSSHNLLLQEFHQM